MRGKARFTDRCRRRPGGAVPSRQHAWHPRLLRRDDPQCAAGARGGTHWGWRASARWHEEKEPRDYPVDSRLARHLIDTLIEREFDIAASDGVRDGEGEGHAIGFV